MATTLYISYTGLMDPLGQSQVLQYVLALSKSHNMALLTFEKADNLEDKKRFKMLQQTCREHGVIWHALTWHNKPSLIATTFDIFRGRFEALKIAKSIKPSIVHCRSYIASIIGVAVKRKTGAKFIFDMRGFWPDERVDGGIWSKKGAPYKIFKTVERHLFLTADHVVSLTKSGAKEFSQFAYLKNNAPSVSVIPTCTNLDLFKLGTRENKSFTLGYIGSVGSWYLFEEVAVAVKRLFDIDTEARFLVVNKGSHLKIESELKAAGVDLSRVEIREANFNEVGSQIARMDAGIFFIKPAWSKRASCPTRMGEFLACGKPCLANEGVGDVKEDFLETNTGVTLPVTSAGNVDLRGLEAALEKLITLASEHNISNRCRDAAEKRFSLAAGVAEYSRIYDRLSDPKLTKDDK